jgi:drug/metabolite transporter (DMT)-like permease
MSGAQMPSTHLGLILLCVTGISVGQVLFKIVALKSLGPDYEDALWKIIFHPYMVGGILIYAAATLLWVWMLRIVPLNLAYPLMGLAFVIVPILSSIFIGEPLKTSIIIGGLLITLGIYVIGR